VTEIWTASTKPVRGKCRNCRFQADGRAGRRHPCDDVAVVYVEIEREALAASIEQADPDQPTLCEGWTVRDLAAHVVVRERRPDTGPGLLIPALHGWSERVRLRYAGRPISELVSLIRTGPPRASLFAVPGVEERVNLVEFFVHTEDVRRGRPGWVPRVLTDDRTDALWKAVTGASRLFLRRSPVGVVLATPDGRTRTARSGEPAVRLTGEPGELLLYVTGRRTHARVEPDGPDDAVAALAAAKLGA
jgi:uncharacterized protein (TIGR03085 family)